MKIDLMFDIETMSTGPRAAIVQIGAAGITEDGDVYPFFNGYIDPVDAARYGDVDPKTLEWWKGQPAYDEVFSGTLSLAEVLIDLTAAIGRVEVQGVWAHPPQFDVVILRNAYEELDRPCPWHFRQERCYRTMWNLFPEVKERKREGTHHNALDDAVHQAECLNEILEHIESMRDDSWKYRSLSE